MASITLKEFQALMNKTTNIRNVSVIANDNKVKSTFTNCLLTAAGTIEPSEWDEDESGTTVSAATTSLYYPMEETTLSKFEGESQGNEFIVNLIDTPVNEEFSPEVPAALRIADGTLLAIDVVSGLDLKTETLLRLALAERVRPIIAVYNVDNYILELDMDGESAYQRLKLTVDAVNALLVSHVDERLGDLQVRPEKGEVAFSAAAHGWAFSLRSFAKFYASKLRVNEEKLMKRMWGDHFYDSATCKWTTENTGSETCKRGFVQFCYEPVKVVINGCMGDNKDRLWPFLKHLNVELLAADMDLQGEALMKRVMQTWLPAGMALLEMAVFHLPSPCVAQNYRAEIIYTGRLDDAYAKAIQESNQDGPLMMYVSKMVPALDMSRLVAFGRVFSGKVTPGAAVHVLGPNYVSGKEIDLDTAVVQGVPVWTGARYVSVDSAPCGCTVALQGLDGVVAQTVTLTDKTVTDASPVCTSKFSAMPVMAVGVKCKATANRSKLIKGLRWIAKTDPAVVYVGEESGQHILAGPSEMHLQTCITQLKERFMDGAEIVLSEPAVAFRETVRATSSRIVASMSPNRCNILYMVARPMEDGLVKAVEDGRFDLADDPAARSKIMVNEFGWDKDLAEKVLCFGPGPTILVNSCNNVEHLDEIVDSVMVGFRKAAKRGAMAEETMRGIRFDLCNAELNPDAYNRSEDEIISAVCRVVYAAQLTAKPGLLEPFYVVEVQSTEKALGGIYRVIVQRRGQIIEEARRIGSPLFISRAYIPVIESFGLASALRAATENQTISVLLVFDHWEALSSDPLEPGSKAAAVVANIRKWKGLSDKMTPLSKYEDQL